MLTKIQAKLIADNSNSFLPSDSSLLNETRTGNVLMDETNHVILWAAGRGRYTAPVSVNPVSGVYTQVQVINFISTLTGLGYSVDDSRLNEHKELIVSWS